MKPLIRKRREGWALYYQNCSGNNRRETFRSQEFALMWLRSLLVNFREFLTLPADYPAQLT